MQAILYYFILFDSDFSLHLSLSIELHRYECLVLSFGFDTQYTQMLHVHLHLCIVDFNAFAGKKMNERPI